MRADLVGLGVRLEWVVADEKEELAITAALKRLRDEGDGILLIYDNANNAHEIGPYIPHGGAAHIIVTSNAPSWNGVAEAVEIERWPKEIGADYLVAQAGRPRERHAALALSEALDGLPLAHANRPRLIARGRDFRWPTIGRNLKQSQRNFSMPKKMLHGGIMATERPPRRSHSPLTKRRSFIPRLSRLSCMQRCWHRSQSRSICFRTRDVYLANRLLPRLRKMDLTKRWLLCGHLL